MKSSPLVLTLLIACGPLDPGVPANPTTGDGAKTNKPAATGDVSIDLENFPVSGIVFEPGALNLNRPGMPVNEPKRKVTLAQQRSIFSNARDPVLKQAQAMILA